MSSTTYKINGRLDSKDASYLRQRGFEIDWKARTVTGKLYNDDVRTHRMIAAGDLTPVQNDQAAQ